MIYGKLNENRLCKVIEQILNERNENYEWKVSLIDVEKTDQECNDNNSEI
jgi:hypothetical protein